MCLFISHVVLCVFFFFFSSRRRHTRCSRDWSSDVCSSDLDDQRRNVGSVVQCHQPLELIRKVRAVGRLTARERVFGEVVCVRQVVHSRQIGRASCRERV